MRKCLQCPNDFEEKRETAKFCSDKCRVAWHRKNGKKDGVTKVQMQVLYNSLLEAVGEIKATAFKPAVYDATKVPTITYDEPPKYSKPFKPLTYEAYRQAKRECETPEQWEELKQRIEADLSLTQKEKNLLKTTNI